MIELEPGNAFAVGQACRFGELTQLPTVHKGLENVLLHRQVAIGHGGHGLAQTRHMFNGLGDPEVRHVVGRGLGAQAEVIPDVLFDRPIATVAADDRIREIEIFDHRFELAAVPFGDLPAEDHGQLRRLANRSIGIKQAFAERIEGGATAEDQVVAVLHLGKEEAMMTGRLPAFGRREEGRQGAEPLLPAAFEITPSERIGERLESGRIAAAQERIPALADGNALDGQPIREPMMLVQAQAGRKRKGGGEADEHPAPVSIDEVEVVLDDPASLVLQMPPLILANGHENARGFAGLEDHDDVIRRCSSKVAIDEVIASSGWRVEDGNTPLRRPSGYPSARTAWRY